jgi:cephalosporin hydroxylase
MLKKLQKKYKARKLDSSFAMHFLDVYEHHFSSIRENPLEILEIGVQYGGSLKMWEEYFPNSNITGVDIDKKCKKYSKNRVKVIIGDQANREFLETLGNFDIIIDDGGHVMKQLKTSLEILWEHLNPGGAYVIEDLETCYWPKFDGAWDRDDTAMETLKSRIDNLNHAAISHDRAENKMTQIKDYGITSMHFYQSLCIIYKEKN